MMVNKTQKIKFGIVIHPDSQINKQNTLYNSYAEIDIINQKTSVKR